MASSDPSSGSSDRTTHIRGWVCGYLTKGAVFGQSRFCGVQKRPTSPGRTWLLDVTNVSVAPYTYTEDFLGDHAVLSRDNLKISFAVHTVWRVGDARLPLFMVGFSTTVTNGNTEKSPDAIVKVAFGHFVREPLRTFARDEVQRRNGLTVKDELIAIGEAVLSASVSTPTQAPSSSAASLWKRPTPLGGRRRSIPKAGRDAGARTKSM